MDLSVVIPARNEIFLARTIESLLENIRGETDIIAVLDGYWPDPPIKDNPRVKLIHLSESIGQRAATNMAARASQSEFILKLDAHCAVDEGFDVKLITPYRNGELDKNVTSCPRLYNLHAFDWECKKCGSLWYQGPTPTKCLGEGVVKAPCDNTTDFQRVMRWKPRLNRGTDFMRFDRELKFQYWKDFRKRPEAKPEIAPTLSTLGACWMLTREKYFELNICDEAFGSWGQQGTEVACKSWLSGGRLMTNKRTWYSHMFRTQGGDFGFPFPMSGKAVDHARKYSKDLFLNDTWPQAKYPLKWLIDKFAPVPDWDQVGV